MTLSPSVTPYVIVASNELIPRNRGCPKGAADSRTWDPTNHWSALSLRKLAPSSQCLAGTNPLYTPKLGGKNLTGIQLCANEVMGVAATANRTGSTINKRHFILPLRFRHIRFPPSFSMRCRVASVYTRMLHFPEGRSGDRPRRIVEAGGTTIAASGPRNSDSIVPHHVAAAAICSAGNVRGRGW